MRPIDADALYQTEKLLGTNIVRRDKVASELLEQVLYDIEHFPTLTPPNEWVSVEERLPDELTMVLIYSGGIYDVAGWIEDEDGKICWTHNAKPQFWRPIPGLEPPGKDNNVPTKEQNEPLTLDELLKMDGEPVYVVPVNKFSELGKWCVLSVEDSDDYSCALVPGIDCWCWRFEAYEEQWLAYRRPPEGEDA